MKWDRDLKKKSWVCGSFVVRIVGRHYVLEHPDLPRKLKYDWPQQAHYAANILAMGGFKK